MRVLPGLRPPPPALVIPPLVRGGCGCCCGCFGSARRRRPVLRRGSRGRGVSSLGRSRLPCAAVLGAGYALPAWVGLRARHAPPTGLGHEKRAPRFGLSLSRSCALHGLERKPPCAFVLRCCPARCRVQPLRENAAPLPNCTKTAPKLHQKASKSALFVRHIAASVPECVNGQYAEKPRFRGFSGSH